MPIEDYAAFFGDTDLAKQSEALPPSFSWTLLNDLHDVHLAYTGLCVIRNRRNAFAGMTPEQFSQRQALLDIARQIIFAERARLLEEFMRLAPR